MESDGLRRRRFPCCTLILVGGALACHICVLIGNLKTASAMDELGSSTSGWSRVGLGLAKSLEAELDAKMHNVTTNLMDTLSHISIVQDALDMVIAIVGNETDNIVDNSPELLQLRQDKHAVMLLQQGQPGPLDAFVPAIAQSVHKVLLGLEQKVSALLGHLLQLLKPALEQVAEWLRKFGDAIQSGIEAFSVTLDKVQKIFDKMMAQLNGHGSNSDEVLNETISLFNVDNSGDISADDLQNVADLYSITALKGDKAEELVAKYDDSGDGELQWDEMQQLITDPTVPDLMAVVLRTYARRMSETGGNVKAARMRDEVALAVSQYFGLVCAKNLTRVSWVADALGNGSLPIQFTADVVAQLCLNEDDPNLLATTSIGKALTQEMYNLHPGHALRTLDLLSNTTFWASEGFDVRDQPTCLRKFTQWLSDAKLGTTPPPSSFQEFPNGRSGNLTAVELLSGAWQSASAADREVLLAMPATAQRIAEEGVALHLLELTRTRQQARARLFSSPSSQLLLQHLLGGVAPGDAKDPSAGERSAQLGQPAKPETLQFAQWLAANATSRADEYQAMCFEYSSQSSSALDSFATQIQAMVSQVQGFLNLMMKYSTPAAIARLESQVQEFAEKAMDDVIKVVEAKVVAAVNSSMPMVEGAVRHAAHETGERLGKLIGKALGTPVGQALKEPMGEIITEMADNSPASQRISETLGQGMADAIANLSAKILGEQAGEAMEEIVMKGLEAASGKLADVAEDKLSLLEIGEEDQGLPDLVSGVWEKMTQTLKSLAHVIPTATTTLKFARTEVSKLYANLNSIFDVFDNQGQRVFSEVATFWRLLWTLYFIFLVMLYPLILYYAFWSGGYFGGPQPLTPGEEEAYQRPLTFKDSCSACLQSCSMCMKSCHDTQLCMWSVVVLFQVVALVVFILSIVLCILAGVKAFLTAGCAQIYVITDDLICREALGTLRGFLETFQVQGSIATLQDSCTANNLLACDLISSRMASSTILTTVFSFIGSLLTFQMVLDSAILHEQARWRRLAARKASDTAASSGAGAA